MRLDLGRRRRQDEDLVIAQLIRRVWWREGSMAERLAVAEEWAWRRATTDADYIDQPLEREIARLARRVRKVEERGR